MNGDQLARVVRKFASDVRKDPSSIVGAKLDALERSADEADRGIYVAREQPVAAETWMSRGVLPAANQQSDVIPIDIPYSMKIFGCHIAVLLTTAQQGIVEPPAKAIDVFLQLNRHEAFTNRTDRNLTAAEDSQVVSLTALDSLVRLLDLELPQGNNVISVKFRWSVPLATVAAMGWGDVQISLNWIVDPLVKRWLGKGV